MEGVDLADLLNCLNMGDFRKLANLHNISFTTKLKKTDLGEKLIAYGVDKNLILNLFNIDIDKVRAKKERARKKASKILQQPKPPTQATQVPVKTMLTTNDRKQPVRRRRKKPTPAPAESRLCGQSTQSLVNAVMSAEPVVVNVST